MNQAPESESGTLPATKGISEDWWANIIGILLLVLFVVSIYSGWVTEESAKQMFPSPKSWTNQIWESVYPEGDPAVLWGLGRTLLACGIVFGFVVVAMGERWHRFAGAFLGVFLLAVLAYVLAQQEVIKAYNIEYALWSIVVGLAISNTIGVPNWLRPALRTELYIKTGLVVYGAEIMLGELLRLAVPGICISWIVTPIVLISTYIIGQRIIGMESRTLNITISADMSVCGVSAAIAAAAACRAKKEELSLAIGISLAFTAVMMVALPMFIRVLGLDPILGGAWIGSTIDSTGAVGAAGAALGDDAAKMAVTIKMIQNMLIGVMAFGIAVYWTTVVERGQERAVGISEVWRRFPKFVLGFLLASAVFSSLGLLDDAWSAAGDVTRSTFVKSARNWFFALAFVSIGLETDFRELGHYFRGGKPVLLYVIGQSINLLLSFAMCYLMIEVIYADFFDSLRTAREVAP